MRESLLVNRPFLVAQISDLHLKAGQRLTYGVVDTLGALRRAVDHLNASTPRPDIVVISGDLVDFGRADEYAVLHPELARLHMPCYLATTTHAGRCSRHSVIMPICRCRQRGRWTGWWTSIHCA